VVHVQEILDIMKILVVIPAYNESATIKDVLTRLKKHNLPVLVIDDGSTDHTGREARQSGAEVIINPKNSGKGATLLTGFRYALDKGFDAVITMDADGQHLPKDIPFFIKAASTQPSGIIIGNRMEDTRTMPFVRILTNKFMSKMLSMLIRQPVPDTQCGFRLIKREVLERIKLTTRNFELESEILLEASYAGFSIHSVAIQTIYAHDKSHIRPFRDSIRFIKFIFRHITARRSR
jgi:glycosyltransferase involved in cell wall biosynthesis